jgi:hypothetical protein
LARVFPGRHTRASSWMPWSRHCMTADRFRGAVWSITATGAGLSSDNGN